MANTVFGFGMFSLLVTLHLGIYAAQILAHLMGMVFNYFMFKAHVFHGSAPAIGPFIGAYALNYLLGLACLAAFHYFISSAYVSGFCSLVMVSTINYFVLKRFVFRASKS